MEPQYDNNGDLRSPKYDEASDDRLVEALTHYNLTGEVQPILYPGFNQHGTWAGIKTSEGKYPDENWTYRIESQKLPLDRLIQTAPDGETTLLGCFVAISDQPVTIEFHHIQGDIDAAFTELLRLPNLKTLDGNLVAKNTRVFNAPKLERVEGQLDINGANHLHAPELQSVKGELSAYNAHTIQLGKLETLGDNIDVSHIHNLELPALRTITGSIFAPEARSIRLPVVTKIGGYLNGTTATEIHAPELVDVYTMDTFSAAHFYNDKIKVESDWNIHPDAKKNWMTKQAKSLMKNTPELEI